jgi:hypothetical protein
MPSSKDEKGMIPSILEESLRSIRHNSELGKIAEFAEAAVTLGRS